jgi:hypothetical protein
MIIQIWKGFKYHDCPNRVCQKMKKDFVRMNLVNVTVTKDQVLEEETRRGNIARKTIQP